MNTLHRPSLASAAVVGLIAMVVGAPATSQCGAAEQNRSYLKDKFQNGDIPTEQDFADTIDSALNFIDDGFHLIDTAISSDGGATILVEGTTVDQNLLYGGAVGLSSAWAGNAGFMAVVFSDGPATHYGYFQLSAGQPGSSELYPMHFEYFVWEDQPNTPLVTSAVPEPSTGLLCCMGLVGFVVGIRARRRTQLRSC